VSAPRRRFFWGQTLSQALARAARQFGLPPERLAYRVRAKRHGYVKHPRAVLIEVDPDSPALAANAAPPAVVAAPERRPAPRPTSRPAAVEERDEEIWDQPDAESELAASEAARRLLAFAGLDLAAEVAAADDRLLLTLRGADEPALRRGGAALLDAFEALLPRAVVSLCGRRVRCRVDGAGVRAAREETLRAAAREGAARARERGEHLLEPLAPAERRLVHLTLESEADLATESLGRGQLKRVRIYLRPAASSD
jgi:spoIIIJ-associated protein